MAITSKSESPAFRRYGSTQLRYAMSYVAITFCVLLFLNIYCSKATQDLFSQSKKTAVVEKCLMASEEISRLEVLNQETIRDTLDAMTSLKYTRLVVTDSTGNAIYDSLNQALGQYLLLPEILDALACNDVFFWEYGDGVTKSRAACPILSHGLTVGCVYLLEYDAEQGQLIKTLQVNVLQITVMLELFVLIFSLIYATQFSRRLKRITNSMKIIQEGDYTHKVSMGGNDELTLLGNEFNDLTERLQTSEQKRRRFVSDASHELKTPLASIKLLTDSILQNDMDGETIREFVGDIGDEAERLNRMTAKLLSLTKVDGQIHEESEIICMGPTIRRAARRLSVIADQAGIDVHLDLENDTPILILEDDLYQIVYNLMENGMKYNVFGGSLTVRLSREEDNAILEVTDTGMGIPEEALGHIFERFYRVDKARSRQSGGSGLGLAIVHAIVERSRGEIHVTSQMGKGSTFRVSFPAFDTEVDRV